MARDSAEPPPSALDLARTLTLGACDLDQIRRHIACAARYNREGLYRHALIQMRGVEKALIVRAHFEAGCVHPLPSGVV